MIYPDTVFKIPWGNVSKPLNKSSYYVFSNRNGHNQMPVASKK